MAEHIVKLDEREETVLQQLMREREMSDGATIRHLFRMGQMIDLYQAQGYKVVFRKYMGQGTIEEIDPFNHLPKMAPMMPTEEIVQEKLKHLAETKVSYPSKGHIDCPCWVTGHFQRVEGCVSHPYDLCKPESH
jgi:hypothetical protein